MQNIFERGTWLAHVHNRRTELDEQQRMKAEKKLLFKKKGNKNRVR